jgi:hypothetical protein
MPRNAPVGSLWIFDPTTQEEAQVEAMPSGCIVQRTTEAHVMVSVRGRENSGRYETGDSVWIEFEDHEALRLMAQLAAALAETYELPERAAALVRAS